MSEVRRVVLAPAVNTALSNSCDEMKRVKPTRCYTMVYWTLWITQHVSGIIMPIIRSLRLHRWPQRVAPHLGYGRLLVWFMAVGLSNMNLMNRSTCFGHYYAHHQELATTQMAPACDTSPWVWQVAGVVHGCRFERPDRGMLLKPTAMHQTSNLS